MSTLPRDHEAATPEQLQGFEEWVANEGLGDEPTHVAWEWYLDEVRESDARWADYMTSLA